MKRTLIAVTLVAILCTSCASDQVFAKSEATIADLGYTNIKYEGYAWVSCDKNDFYALKYSTTSASGRRVTLAACSGVFKGVTVRTIN
jgi:hypothetical protein